MHIEALVTEGGLLTVTPTIERLLTELMHVELDELLDYRFVNDATGIATTNYSASGMVPLFSISVCHFYRYRDCSPITDKSVWAQTTLSVITHILSHYY
jgi:hypothetical protein